MVGNVYHLASLEVYLVCIASVSAYIVSCDWQVSLHLCNDLGDLWREMICFVLYIGVIK